MALKASLREIETLTEQWIAQGLEGVEVYHPSTGDAEAAFLRDLALRKGLLITSGSDYHRDGEDEHILGESWPRWQHANADLNRFMARIGLPAVSGS